MSSCFIHNVTIKTDTVYSTITIQCTLSLSVSYSTADSIQRSVSHSPIRLHPNPHAKVLYQVPVFQKSL